MGAYVIEPPARTQCPGRGRRLSVSAAAISLSTWQTNSIPARGAVLLPLVVFGFSQPAVITYVVLVGLQAVVAHANLGIRFGWLEYLLVTPR